MPISRPLLIALIAAVVALVAFYATQGSSGSDGQEAPPPVETVAAAPLDRAESGASEPAAQAGRSAAAAETKKSAAGTNKPTTGSSTERNGDARATAGDDGMPPNIARALRDRKTVVLYLGAGTSTDDRETAAAVDALRGTSGVLVVGDSIERIGRYSALVGSLGIAQAPAVVIVGPDRKARVLEGYIDPATLAQDVADAR